jgi:26S proteasome regulatory subunit N11
MERIQRLLSGGLGGAGMGAPNPDDPVVDTAETVHLSSLALLKMLKHGIFTFI